MAIIYVPDDYPSIQQAIDAAAPGDTVLVRPGTYTEPNTEMTTPMIEINKPLTLQSTDGPAVTILDGNSASERYYVVSVTADDVTFDGFTVTNPLYDGPADASGILTSLTGRPANLRILNNIVHDVGQLTRPVASFGTFGINVGPVDGLEIANNVVYNIGNDDGSDPANNGWAIGVFIYGNSSVDTANQVNVHDNTVYNIVSPVDVNDGITTGSDSENITIANNDIHASSLKRGIVTNPAMVGPTTIRGNTVADATLYGILLRSPDAQTVTANTVTACGIGIRITDAIAVSPEITGNNIFGNIEYGLLNESSLTVDAQNNWWGSAAGPNTPGADRVGGLGPVLDALWLTSPEGTAIVSTGPIANPVNPTTGQRSTAQLLIEIENIGDAVASVQIVGYYLSDSRTLYALQELSLAPAGMPNSVYSNTYYADFGGWEYQFVPSAPSLLISVWGISPDGALVSAHRLVHAELTSLV